VTAASLRNQLDSLGFGEVVCGRRRLYIARPFSGQAEGISRHLTSMGPSDRAAGNRRSAVALTVEGMPPLFVRRSRRGGLMRFLLSELYVGFTPRPLQELMVNADAYQRGLPVVEPVGAMVEALGPCCYRGCFLTRALDGVTLWNLLLAGGEPEERREALVQTRLAIDQMHDGGLYHADLNFHNLFVRSSDAAVVVLDLDKARLYPAPLAQALRRRNFRRLGRSALRLIKAGALLTPKEAALLGLG
jgi:hypothetical protein